MQLTHDKKLQEAGNLVGLSQILLHVVVNAKLLYKIHGSSICSSDTSRANDCSEAR